ncbi:MAG: hypothetical protein NXI31_05980 [bacterium]|nr:hypothetical protein [bacterium]
MGRIYRCEAVSVEAFVQQLACACVRHGYWNYVRGEVPARKDPRALDEKFIARYELAISPSTRYRRKKEGVASVQYLRLGREWVLVATKGEHRFYEDHPPRMVRVRGGGRSRLKSIPQVRSMRTHPFRFHGYSVSVKRDREGRLRTSVRIHPEEYRRLKVGLMARATVVGVGWIEAWFRELWFAPYAPIRSQVLSLHRQVNFERKLVGLPVVPRSCVRLVRRSVPVFVKPVDEDGRGMQRCRMVDPEQCRSRELFRLGRVIATHGVLALVSEEEVAVAVNRHLSGDWGDVCAEDRQANEHALRRGARLLSTYHLRSLDADERVKVYIITEADRSCTTVLLPAE